MWPQDIDLSLDNQCRAVWAELSSDFGWSVEQSGRGPFWAVGVGGFSLVSRATRLGATMGHYGRPETTDFRWSVGQPGWGPLWATWNGGFPLVSGATSESPPQGAQGSPASWHPVPLQAGPLGRRKVRWSVRATIPPAPASPPAPPWLCLSEELS